MNLVYCFQCSSKHTYQGRLSFREECENCRADLHVCKNCSFYDKGAYNECRESSADVVQDKERRNVCEYFQPCLSRKDSGSSKEELLKQAEALFKKK